MTDARDAVTRDAADVEALRTFLGHGVHDDVLRRYPAPHGHLRRILTLAAAGLDAQAAVERARSEERARCIRRVTTEHQCVSCGTWFEPVDGDCGCDKPDYRPGSKWPGESLRALGPTSDAVASARAAAIEECARWHEEQAAALRAMALDDGVAMDRRLARVQAHDHDCYAAALRSLAKKEPLRSITIFDDPPTTGRKPSRIEDFDPAKKEG